MCFLHYLYTPSSQGNIVRGSEVSEIEDCAANYATIRGVFNASLRPKNPRLKHPLWRNKL